MKTPILGSAYVARSINAADNRMINLFPEVVPEGGKEAAFLLRAPGLRLLASIGDGPIRGMWSHGNYAYIVSGYKLYKVDSSYTATLIGTVLGEGPVSMTDNGYVMFIAAGSNSYQYLLSGETITFAGSITNTTLKVTSISAGSIYEGMPVIGTGIDAATTIVSQTDGTIGGVGTYEVSISQTIAAGTIMKGPAPYQEITSDSFLGASVVVYVDTYFIYMEPNSQRVYSVDTFDSSGSPIYPLVFDATNVASAEGSPDNLVSIIVDHNELWLFGTNSVEVWYDAGGAAFPFSRIQGAFNELGCAATFSVAKMENGLFWLGADARGRGMIYRANGYRGERISTHAVEYAIGQYSVISDAIAYTYQQEGHSFYVITFPTANATWVFDASTNAWHERAGWENSTFVRHRGNCQLAFNNEILIGDYRGGNIYAFDLDVHSDNNDVQRWLRSWRALPPGQNTLKRTAHKSLQLDCESGIGITDQYFEGELATESINFSYALYLAAFPNNTYLYSAGNITSAFNVGDYVSGPYIQTNTRVSSVVYSSGYTYIYLTLATTYTGGLPYTTTFNFSNTVDTYTITTELDEPIEIDSYHTFGANPEVMLRWSDDGGHTWSNEHWANMGKIGEFYRRVLWRRLGMTTKIRDRVYEVSGSDPIKIAIMGAELQIEETAA